MCVPEGVNTRSLVGMVSYTHVTGFLWSMLNVVSVICSLMIIDDSGHENVSVQRGSEAPRTDGPGAFPGNLFTYNKR